MRQAISLALAAAALAVTPAGASNFTNNSTQPMYYWEVDPPGGGLPRFGWEASPRPWRVSGPVVRKAGESLQSFCARQVGRILRIDEAGLMRSTMFTDGCVRRGGRY